MSRGRYNIGGDALPFTSPSFGLLSVATPLEIAEPTKWKLGLQWRAICPDANGTHGECTDITGVPLAPAKSETWDQETRGATPVTVYSRTDCAPVGEWDQLGERNRTALLRSEERELERIFWTGDAGDGVISVFPHLEATAPVIDGNDLLQPAVTVVTNTPQTIEVGVGMLEDAMRDCYPGVATLHVPLRLAALMAEAYLLTAPRSGQVFTSSLGSKVAFGNYPGNPPGMDPLPGVTWIYATGSVFYMREPVPHTFRPVESFDRGVNTLSMIAERTYVIGWDCCLMAIPIINGEDVTP